MDITEIGIAVSLFSVSLAVLKLNKGEKVKSESNHASEKIDAVKLQKDLSERLTFKESEERYTNTKLCLQIHTQVNEKLACLPEIKESLVKIKTKMKIKDD